MNVRCSRMSPASMGTLLNVRCLDGQKGRGPIWRRRERGVWVCLPRPETEDEFDAHQW
jgi:hypothetical protein